MSLTPYFSVEDNICMTEFMLLHPVLLFILADFNLWSLQRGLNVKYTRIVDEMIPGVSVTNGHAEGRMVDASIHGWSIDEIERCIENFNEKYKDVAAFSDSDGKPRLIPNIYHGTAPHFHFQIRPNLPIEQIYKYKQF